MGTTSDGYPYPEGTDLVVDGDDAIKALAEALTGRTVTYFGDDYLTPNDPPSAYAAGWSIFALSSAAGAAWGLSGAGAVLTFRKGSGSQRSIQYAFRAGGDGVARVRTTGTGSTWSGWSGGGAAGSGSVDDIPAGSHGSTTVTFPAARFSSAPAVNLTARTAVPNIRGAIGVTGVSATAFTASIMNGGSGVASVQFYWTASPLPVSTLLREDVAVEPDAVVTCPIEDCENAGIGIEIASTWTDDDGETHAVDAVECGVCGADITDTLTPIGG